MSCIITQVHIPEYDPQGNLTAVQKLKLVEYGLYHLRQYNPQSYLILTGHGQKPKNTDLCDHIYWEDTCRPLNQYGYVQGMPAQYKFVSKGIEHALKKGYNKILKTRGDSIIHIKNVTQEYDKILQNKKLLITQQTGPERLGDCFMYGDTELLYKTWHEDNPVHHEDGLQNTAYHFRTAINNHKDNWLELLHHHCTFKDINKLKCICLRWNYHNLNQLSEEYQAKLLDPNYNSEPYHWGKANGWHSFDKNGNMSGTGTIYYSEKEFYANSNMLLRTS